MAGQTLSLVTQSTTRQRTRSVDGVIKGCLSPSCESISRPISQYVAMKNALPKRPKRQGHHGHLSWMHHGTDRRSDFDILSFSIWGPVNRHFDLALMDIDVRKAFEKRTTYTHTYRLYTIYIMYIYFCIAYVIVYPSSFSDELWPNGFHYYSLCSRISCGSR